MKKYLLLIPLFLCLSSCIVNKKVKTTVLPVLPFLRSLIFNQNVYKTKDTISLVKVYDNSKGNKTVIHDDNTYVLTLPENYRFIRYRLLKDGDLQVIKVPDLSQQSVATANTKSTINLDISNGVDLSETYFSLKYPKLVTPAQKYLATEHITAMPLTIPAKIRFNAPANRDMFSLNANVAYSFGYRIRVNNNPYKNNYVRLILLSAGLGTETYLKADSIANDKYKGETNIALSLASGLSYEMDDKWNFGILIGRDRMFGNKKDWYYQNKTWFGIGFGFKFGGGTDKEDK